MKNKFTLNRNKRQLRLKQQMDASALHNNNLINSPYYLYQLRKDEEAKQINYAPNYQIKFTNNRDEATGYIRNVYAEYRANNYAERYNWHMWMNRKSPFINGLIVWCTVVPYSEDNQPLLDIIFNAVY